MQMYPKSKNHDKLYFKEEGDGEVGYFEHDFGGYKLEGRVLFNKNNDQPWVLSIHGARADFTKSDAVTLRLQEQGLSVLGMNLSGHNDASPLKPEQTTLQNNVDEAEAFFNYLDPNKKKVVIAYSLGGTPALKLLAKHASEISHLILFYPGVYDAAGYQAHFGDEFRAVITKPYSYRHNDTIQLLKDFKGKLLLITGQYDGLDPVEYGKPAGTSAGEIVVDGQKYYSPIPKEVIDLVRQAVPQDRRAEIVVPNCGHSVVLYAREHPEVAENLTKEIIDFLANRGY